MKRDPNAKERIKQKPRVIGSFEDTGELPDLNWPEKTPRGAPQRGKERAEAFPSRPLGEMTRLEKLRRRRRMRKVRLGAVCVLIAAGILAYFTGLYGASLALVGDTFDSVRIALTPSDGYPAALDVPGYVTAVPFAGGAAVLGEQDLKMIAANGNEVYSVQHNFSRPAITAGNTRVCLYNRNSSELVVYNRSRKLFENQYQDPIYACAMSPNGTLAVFQQSALTVYDPLFEPIFQWKTSEVPTALAFAQDNRQFAVGTPQSVGGALGGKVYLYTTDVNAPDAATAVIDSADGVPVGMQYLNSKQLLVVYNTYCAVYSTADGGQQARYDYGGRTLQGWAVSSGANNAVLLFGDGAHSSMTRLCVLDAQLVPLADAAVGRIATGVAATRTGAYVATANSVLSYGLDGAYLGESVQEAHVNGLVASKKLFLLTEGQLDVFVPPAAEQTASAAS